jgi:hypothetical protein
VKTTELVNNLKFNDNYSFKIINPDQYAWGKGKSMHKIELIT